MQRLAAVTSIIFHPLLMPLLCVALAGELDWYVRSQAPQELLNLTYLVVALSTIAFPGLNIILLKWYGALSDLEVRKRQERFIPYISSGFFFILGYVLLRRGALPLPVYAIMIGCISSIALLALLNIRFKMSAHAAGSAGLLGTVLALFQLHGWSDLPLLMCIVLLLGLVLSARLVLKIHTPMEVYGGAVLGFLCLYLSVSRLWVI